MMWRAFFTWPFRPGAAASRVVVEAEVVAVAADHGRVVQFDPIKPALKAPGTKRLKLGYEKLLSSFAFKCNLCRYTMGDLSKGKDTNGKPAGAVWTDAAGSGLPLAGP
jgi:hypothetical protein